MKEFKWTIEYTLSLTYPAFMHLTFMVDRIRSDAAIDGIYAGYTAGKYGARAAESLFHRRGSFVLKPPIKPYTDEQLQEAAKKAEEILKKNV